MNANFPDKQSVDLSRQLGVEFFLVDKASYPDAGKLIKQCEDLGLRFVNEIDGQLVFEFKK